MLGAERRKPSDVHVECQFLTAHPLTSPLSRGPLPLALLQVSSLSEPLQSTRLLLALVGSAGHSHCSSCGPTYPKLLVRPVSEPLGVLFRRGRLLLIFPIGLRLAGSDLPSL